VTSDDGPLTALSSGREALQQVREMLAGARPDTVEHCRPLLEKAVDLLAHFERQAGTGAAVDAVGARAELARWRRDLRHVSALLDNAACFYLGWSRILAVEAAEYGPPPPHAVVPISGIRLQG
jgi:hypothetical protein